MENVTDTGKAKTPKSSIWEKRGYRKLVERYQNHYIARGEEYCNCGDGGEGIFRKIDKTHM